MSTYTPEYYLQLEEAIRALLNVVRPYADSGDIEETNEYLDHGEYGLALEVILQIMEVYR